MAVMTQNSKLIQFFFKKGISVHIGFKNEKSSLDYAYTYADIDAIKYFFSYTPIFTQNIYLQKLLSRHHFLVIDQLLTEKIILFGQLYKFLYDFSNTGNVEVIEYILKNATKIGFDLFAPLVRPYSPVQIAMQLGHFHVVKVFLQFDESLASYPNYAGDMLLHMAVSKSSTQMTEFLIQKAGHTINSKNIQGQTPLHYAANKGSLDLVRLLVKNGAQINSKDHTNKNPIFYAYQKNHENVVEFLATYNVNLEEISSSMLLRFACKNGNMEKAKLLIETGANVNEISVTDGKTALHLATEIGHLELIKILVLSGAKINTQDFYGFTPLALAVQGYYTEIVEFFILNTDVKVNTPNKINLESPLMIAAHLGDETLVRLLIKSKKVNINHKNLNGFTAIEIASGHGYTNIVEILQVYQEKNNRKIVFKINMEASCSGSSCDIFAWLRPNSML
jgi:ankyrin repeat protein